MPQASSSSFLWSVRDMATRQSKNVFELMALKEKIAIARKMQALNVLQEEINKAETLEIQLDDALLATKDRAGEQNIGQLRSNAWYRNQIMDQRVSVKNRHEFLSKEVSTERVLIAQARIKREKSVQKSAALGAEELVEKTNKFEADLAGRRRGGVND